MPDLSVIQGYKEVPIGSKPCWEVIDNLSDISDKEKELMKAELPFDVDYICPDTKSLIVEGGLTSDSYLFNLYI